MSARSQGAYPCNLSQVLVAIFMVGLVSRADYGKLLKVLVQQEKKAEELQVPCSAGTIPQGSCECNNLAAIPASLASRCSANAIGRSSMTHALVQLHLNLM